MNPPDLHMLTGAYAAHALDDGERAEFEVHLRDCASCRAEVAELTATTARLAAAAATVAPGRVRVNVLQEVARTRQLTPLPRPTRLTERSTRWYRQPVSAAAALLLVVSASLGAVTLRAQQQADDAELRAQRIVAIATDPNRIEQVAPVSTGGHGVVVVGDGAAILRTSPLRRLPMGRVYQLWVLRPDGPQSAGVLGDGGRMDAVVEDMTSAVGVAITVEPSGGSTEPTGKTVLRLVMA